MDELKKIDEIRSRTGVSYARAKEVLDQCDGDLLQALILLESTDQSSDWAERIQVQGEELIGKVKELIHEGNVRRIIIRQGDRTLLEFPVTVGALGIIFLPTLAALGAIAALVTECTLFVERTDETNGGGCAPECRE